MKRFVIILCIMVLSFFCFGCTKAIELTDDETYMIAEYAAELLMKYDKNIDLKYYYEDDSATTTEEEQTTEDTLSSETETATEEMTTEKKTTEEAKTEEAETDKDTQNTADEMEEVEKVDSSQGEGYDFARLLGEDNISIKYSYYMLLDKYPSYDQDGMFIEIEAPSGYKLLVLKFNLENKTNEVQDVNLYDKDVSYKLIVDETKSTKPMLTILMDDLYTYQKTLDASMFEETVLLFQISDSVAKNMSKLQLQVNYNNNTETILLQ